MTTSTSTTRPRAWPPVHWMALGFVGGFLLMLNHFADQGLAHSGSEAALKALATWASPIPLLASGALALAHARRVAAGHALGWLRLVALICASGVVVLVPLVALECALFPVGHGIPEGARIAVRHLPFVAVFVAGTWCAAAIHRGDRHALVAIVAPAPAGLAFGMALVYGCLAANELLFHWNRCRDAASLVERLKCFF